MAVAMAMERAGRAGSAHFVHVMKTGGTSLLVRAREQYGVAQVWPQDVPGARAGEAHYGDAGLLRALGPEERRGIRFFAGHHPFVATELSGAPVTLTVLRDPVERAVSMLRQLRRFDPDAQGCSLEELYDDPWKRGMFVWEYQVRQFAKTLDDDLRHLASTWVDDAALERAQANLRRVTVLGLQERYEEFEDAACRVLGWPRMPFPKRQVGTDDATASPELRERIAADNPMDAAFYRFAVELYEERAAAASAVG